MSRALDGRTALVTGGGTGIGKGIAQRLLEEGACVTLAARREDVLAAAAEELVAEVPGAQVEVVRCDVTRGEDVDRAVEIAARATGGLDIAIANAGGAVAPTAFLDLDEAAWRAALDLNVVGTANTFGSAARAMRERGGAMVAISSEAAINTVLAMAHYSSAKAAVDMLVRCAAVELGPLGIRVNAVRPGMTLTESWPGADFPEAMRPALDEVMAGMLDAMLLGRFGTPRDVADTVLHLVGPASTWITGQSYTVDGGFAVPRRADLRPMAAARKALLEKQ